MSKLLLLDQNEPMAWPEAIADFVIAQKASGLTLNTLKFYEYQLSLLKRRSNELGICLQAFTARHMRQYLAWRADNGVGENTRRHDATCARLFFRFCLREEYIAKNPLADYEIPRRRRAFTRKPTAEELCKLIASQWVNGSPVMDRWNVEINPKAKYMPKKVREFFSARDFAVLTGLITTGARISELVELKTANVYLKERRIVFEHTKNGQERHALVEQAWIEIIEAWIKVRPRVDTPHLFVSLYGEPLTTGAFRQQFDNYMDFAGLEGFTLHGLRHYAGTEFAKVNLWKASELLGHKHLDTTAYYLHTDTDHLRQVHESASPLAKVLVNSRYQAQVKAKAKRKRIV